MIWIKKTTVRISRCLGILRVKSVKSNRNSNKKGSSRNKTTLTSKWDRSARIRITKWIKDKMNSCLEMKKHNAEKKRTCSLMLTEKLMSRTRSKLSNRKSKKISRGTSDKMILKKTTKKKGRKVK